MKSTFFNLMNEAAELNGIQKNEVETSNLELTTKEDKRLENRKN